MANTLVFVYGTLKRGLRNHALLAGSEFFSEARTVPGYRLYNCGRYPGLVPVTNNGVAVQGEVWRVGEETLRRLDEFEGVPSLFVRERVLLDLSQEPVFAYLYARDVSGLGDCGETWRG